MPNISKSETKTDVVIVGGGASGLMCAMTAGARGKKVVVLERGERPARKIELSGGGRCNFSNLGVSSQGYRSGDPSFVDSVLSKFGPEDFIKLIKAHGIEFEEKERRQLFCKRSSKGLIEMLLAELKTARVQVITGGNVTKISKDGSGEFCIETDRGIFASRSLVIATGGISYPQIGATNFGFQIAREFGLKVGPLTPGLVPLVYGEKERRRLSKLSGISVDVTVHIAGLSIRGGMLFTHTGVSGPAVLNSSLYWKKGDRLTVDLLPDADVGDILNSERKKGRKAHLHSILSGLMPRRLAECICEELGSRPISEYKNDEIEKIAGRLHNFKLSPSDTAGFGRAEVTVGGIALKEIDPNSMESKKVRGLYFTGELLDAAGMVGGFNLHFAWASGYIAGKSV